MSDPIHSAAQALRNAWDSPDRWSNPGYERVKKAETAHRDALAARAQPTTDDVLWEGETARIPVAGQDGMAMDHWSAVLVPPGTRVRVVRATDQPSEDSTDYWDDEAVMPRVKGKPFRCSCSGNVFSRHETTYQCNSCGTQYEGVPADQLCEDRPEPTPEDKLVDLMGELERSVNDARASRRRRAEAKWQAADQPTEVAGDE